MALYNNPITNLTNNGGRELAKIIQDELIDVHITGKRYATNRNAFYKNTQQVVGSVDLSILQHISTPQTPALFESLRATFAKIFRANGYSVSIEFSEKYYNLEQDAHDYLGECFHGESLHHFIEHKWQRLYDESPNSIILIDLPNEPSNTPEPYPVIIGFDFIKGIEKKHGKITKLCYCVGKDKDGNEIIREINKLTDELYVIEGDSKKYLINENGEPEIKQNILGYVPAIQAGTINIFFNDEVTVTNHYYHGLLMADKYQRLCNDHDLSVFKHGYPLFYSYPVSCSECNGVGKIYNHTRKLRDNNGETCMSCKGQGHKLFQVSNPSEGIMVPISKEKQKTGDLQNVPVPAGYIGRPESIIKMQMELKDVWASEIERAVMGMSSFLQRTTSSATESLINYQPVLDRMYAHSQRAQKIECFLANCILDYRYNTTLLNGSQLVTRFINCDVIYGTDYRIRDEHTIQQELSAAIVSGESQAYQLALLREKIETRFCNNDHERIKALLLMEVEPMVLMSVEKVLGMATVSDQDKWIKTNFIQLINDLENVDNLNITKLTAKELKEKLVMKYLEFEATNEVKEEPKIEEYEIQDSTLEDTEGSDRNEGNDL